MLTMAPGRPAATIARATAWAQRKPPLRFTPSTWSHSRSVSSRNGERGKTPALLTRMSGGPSPPVTAATRACTSRACATSPLTVRTLRPRPRISPATRSAAPGSSRKFRPTSAPSPAIASAMARPIPCCAPVTSATLPASRIGSLRYSSRRPLIIRGVERREPQAWERPDPHLPRRRGDLSRGRHSARRGLPGPRRARTPPWRWPSFAISRPSCSPPTGCSPPRVSAGRSGPASLLEPHVLQGRRPRVGIDQHQGGLGHPRAHPARPDVIHDRCEADPLVERALDLVQQDLPLAGVGLPALLLVERVDVGLACVREGAIARHRLRHPGSRVAVDRVDAHAEAVDLLRGQGRVEGGPLHRPQAHLDPHRAQVAADRLPHRGVGRPRMEVARVRSRWGTPP